MTKRDGFTQRMTDLKRRYLAFRITGEIAIIPLQRLAVGSRRSYPCVIFPQSLLANALPAIPGVCHVADGRLRGHLPVH